MGANIVLQGPNGERIRVNPARDVINYWGQLLAKSVEMLQDPATWPEDLKSFMMAEKVTTQELVECAFAIEEACRLAYTGSGFNLPIQALEKTGFTKFRPIVKAAVTMRIGQVSMGAWWYGIRDSVMEGTVPACNEDLIKAGLTLADALNKLSPAVTPAPTEEIAVTG